MTTCQVGRSFDLREPGRVLLVSCYELGHQPQGIAVPLAFLERAGFSPAALDVSVEPLDPQRVARARFVGISVPMHTALRLGVGVMARIRESNPGCVICCYGLYAGLNEEYLLAHGADFCVGGEYAAPLVELIETLDRGGALGGVEGVASRSRRHPPQLKRGTSLPPVRDKLPPLARYARLAYEGQLRTAGYAEASRGCLHRCTHCPIPPVYAGRFFATPVEVVMQDVRAQVAAGATHISFGDPDFLNGPTHAVRVIRAMHSAFPVLTFDFTAKIEHLLTRAEHLKEYGESGCLFIISAAESMSDRVLRVLAKHHTAADVGQALNACRTAGIALRPTWVAFTPWTTHNDYLEMLAFIEREGLIDHIDPVQYSIRLLIPPGSWLAEHPATAPYRGPLDEAALTYRWQHPDPRMDELQGAVARLVEREAAERAEPIRTFYRIWALARGEPVAPARAITRPRKPAPRLTESWFC